MSRRERKLLRRKGKRHKPEAAAEHHPKQDAAPKEETKKRKRNKILDFYEKNYRKNMWITIALLIISILIIGVHTAMYGEFIPRGVSLKGGVTITVPYEQEFDTDTLQTYLRDSFPDGSISVRAMTSAGTSIGFIVDASDVDPEELLEAIRARVGEIEKYSLETMGSALGNAFFKQTLIAILIAFVLMSIVVFFSFKTFVPSFAVILSAVSDIMMTVAVIDLLGIKIETAGIAALLMVIGYSVDTDILLTTRVLKRQEGHVFDRIIGAMKTGVTMTVTSLAAVTIAYFFTQSETLKQIMLILIIGLIFDLLNTWIQNVGILRMYIEHKSKKKAAETLAEFETKDDDKDEADKDEADKDKADKDKADKDKADKEENEKREAHHPHHKTEHKAHHGKAEKHHETHHKEKKEHDTHERHHTK